VHSKSLQIPSWVRKAFCHATERGIVKKPRTGWDQFTMSSFFRQEKRCWFISDSYYFQPGTMVCEPETGMDGNDPIVIEQCDFLADLLCAKYQITQLDDLIRVEFRCGGI